MRQPCKISSKRNRGLNRVILNGTMESLSLDLLVLEPSDRFELETGPHEAAIVPLTGSVTIEAGGKTYSLKRRDVFTDKASALCLPRDARAVFFAETYTELALCKARTSEAGSVIFIPKEGVKEKTVGRDSWERKVVDIIDRQVDAKRIVLGETFNKPACWSSFPPHKHDTSIPGVEAKMEEIYLFRVNPEKGFGTQTIYKNGSSSTFTIKDYDAVTIPWGYHPVSASPGTSLYYLWFLAGKDRELRPNTDPDFRFLEERANA